MVTVYQVTKKYYFDETKEDGFEIGGIYRVKTEQAAVKAYEKQYGKEGFHLRCVSDAYVIEEI